MKAKGGWKTSFRKEDKRKDFYFSGFRKLGQIQTKFEYSPCNPAQQSNKTCCTNMNVSEPFLSLVFDFNFMIFYFSYVIPENLDKLKDSLLIIKIILGC